MSRLTTVADLAAGDAIPESWVDAVRVNSNYDAMPGGDLASATTLTLTNAYHKVTGTATIDNLSDAVGAVAGQEVALFATGACTIRHIGGGTGNIRTSTGADAAQMDSGNVIVAGSAAIEIDFAFKSAVVGNFDNAYIRFNADAGANYDSGRQGWIDSGARVDGASLAAVGALIAQVPASTGLANMLCVGRLTLIGYDNAKHKAFNIHLTTANNTNTYSYIMNGRWKSTAAITSVQVVGAGGNILAGGRLIVRKQT